MKKRQLKKWLKKEGERLAKAFIKRKEQKWKFPQQMKDYFADHANHTTTPRSGDEERKT